jgi:type II secretory pathway component GspD/PulD (secretin)
VNAPLEAVMERVSEATGVPIFIDDLVKRLATVRLTDVDLDRFVSAVVAGYGLTAVREDGAYLVSDGLPTSLAPYTAGRTRVFKLKHLGASTAINLLPNFLLHYLRPSASGDAVVAHGPEQLLDRIAEDLAVLDKPVQAVRVRAVVVEAHDTTASRRLWRLLRGGDRTVVAVDTERGSLGFRRGERPLERYVAAIEALDRRGKIEVRGQPALVVLPGTGAEIFVGERQYYQQLAAFWWQEEDVELRYAEAGVRLWCRPRATGSGLIETRVRVEVSTLRRGLVGAVVVDRRRARGTMLLQSGETLILGGGLYLHQAERERHRPGPLRRVPLLGAASRAEAQGDELREVVFLLCAEQVETSQPAAAAPAPGGPPFAKATGDKPLEG